MIEAIAFIVFAMILGPAIFVLADEWRELKEDRDFYRDFYEAAREEREAASRDRHPSGQRNMTQLRRIK